MADFSAETIRIWGTLREIVAAGDHRRWEPEGRQREYYDLNSRLDHDLLGLLPHECAPIWAVRYGPPPSSLYDDAAWTKLDCREQWSRESFVRAWKLAGMLDAAAASKHQPTSAREPASS